MDILFPHHVGHYVGLDVHDCPEISRKEKLKANMCITIEPYSHPSKPILYHELIQITEAFMFPNITAGQPISAEWAFALRTAYVCKKKLR
jgi:Xaa-Pro aminopeptidase